MKIAVKKYGDELNWIDAEEISIDGVKLQDILTRLKTAEKIVGQLNDFVTKFSKSILKKATGTKRTSTGQASAGQE